MNKLLKFFFDRSIPEPNSGCWLWLNAVSRQGYGILNIRGRTARAHREAFIAAGGAIPFGLDVCHRCDVRCCVNPDHLFVGTRADNMRDCADKGRIVIPNLRGEQLTQSRLTEADVREIRASTIPMRALARHFGVNRGTIACIVKGKTWRHI